MSDVTTVVQSPNLQQLISSIAATLREHWNQAASYQKFLYCFGSLFIASGVFHVGVLLATRGSILGPVSWRKPIAFGLSTGLTSISLAWVMTLFSVVLMGLLRSLTQAPPKNLAV